MTDTDTPLPRNHLIRKLRGSLSAKLLLLTVTFVLVVEVVLMIPSVAKQRVDWLNARIEAAYLVGLALEAPEAEMIKPEDVAQLFATANILGVTVNRDGARIQIFAPYINQETPPPMHFIDLGESNLLSLIGDAWGTVFSTGDDMVRVIGHPMYSRDGAVDIIVSQRALRQDLLTYARNILGLSLIISAITAALVYWSLNRMIVKPVRQLTRSMAAFHANPDDPKNIVAPSQRVDEVGVAERSLHALEMRTHDLLSQRRRLAALGSGISKISHDLRNILASAQLMSDRLAKSDDPRVRKLSPRLLQALDRAIALSRDTLSYGRMEASSLSKSQFALSELVDEVFEDTASMHIAFNNEVAPNLTINADRNQLYRALFNLVRNAIDVLTSEDVELHEESTTGPAVTVRAANTNNKIIIDVIDNGPGLPDEAKQHLFEPFKGSVKPGGSGLGVAIAYEIMRAHNGALALKSSGPEGAVFALSIPNE